MLPNYAPRKITRVAIRALVTLSIVSLLLFVLMATTWLANTWSYIVNVETISYRIPSDHGTYTYAEQLVVVIAPENLLSFTYGMLTSAVLLAGGMAGLLAIQRQHFFLVRGVAKTARWLDRTLSIRA